MVAEEIYKEPLAKRVKDWFIGALTVVVVSFMIVGLLMPLIIWCIQGQINRVYWKEIETKLSTSYPGEQFNCLSILRNSDGECSVIANSKRISDGFSVSVDSSGRIKDNYWGKLHSEDTVSYINNVLSDGLNCSVGSNVEVDRLFDYGTVNSSTPLEEVLERFGTVDDSGILSGEIYLGTHFSDISDFQKYCEGEVRVLLQEHGCYGEYIMWQGTSRRSTTLDDFVDLRVTQEQPLG